MGAGTRRARGLPEISFAYLRLSAVRSNAASRSGGRAPRTTGLVETKGGIHVVLSFQQEPEKATEGSGECTQEPARDPQGLVPGTGLPAGAAQMGPVHDG